MNTSIEKIELENLKKHFNLINIYSTNKIKLIGIENLTSIEKYDIANFKIKYHLIKLLDFKNEELIDELIMLGENIIDLKN